MGLNQKQAVAVLYVISAILGLSAVVLATSGALKAILCLMALLIVAVVAARVVFLPHLSEEERKNLKEHSLREELAELEGELHQADGKAAAAPPEGEEDGTEAPGEERER